MSTITLDLSSFQFDADALSAAVTAALAAPGTPQTVAGTSALSLTASVAVAPPPPISPPPPPPAPPPVTLANAVVTGTVEGQSVSLTVNPGERVPLVTGSFAHGAVMYYADGSIVVENSYVGDGNPTPADIAIDLTITVGDKTFTTGAITVWYLSWTRPFWIVQPKVQTFDRSLFPYYKPGSENASQAAAYAKADNGPLGFGLWDKSMADTGERGDLGDEDQWDASYLCNPSAANAVVVFGQADASAPFDFHAIDTATNKMLIAGDYPHTSWQFPGIAWNPFKPYKSVHPCSLSEAQAHAPAFNALACALRGTEYDRASLAQWTCYICNWWANYSYRITPDGPNSIVHSTQTRGAAWALRTLAQAWKLCPDYTSYFDGWLTAMLGPTELAKLTAQPSMPMIKTDLVYGPGAGTDTDPNRGYAPWQLDFVVQALGYAIQLGRKDAQPWLDYFSPLMAQRMGLPNAEGKSVPHEFACLYSMTYKDASGNVAADWVQSVQFTAKTNTRLAAALTCAEGSVDLQSAMNGLPVGQLPPGTPAGDFAPVSCYAYAATGYPAMFNAAMAYYASYATDQATAQAAWKKFNTYYRADCSNDPKYNLDVVPAA